MTQGLNCSAIPGDAQIHQFVNSSSDCCLKYNLSHQQAAFPLHICAKKKIKKDLINVAKKILRNYGVSINLCYATNIFSSCNKSRHVVLVGLRISQPPH